MSDYTIVISGATYGNVYFNEASDILNEHINNINNPHSVTKDQIGLGAVINAEQLLHSQLTQTLEASASGSVPSSKAVADYISAQVPAYTGELIVDAINNSDDIINQTHIDSSIARLTQVSNLINAATSTLVSTNDARLTNARTPLSHTHTTTNISNFDMAVSGNVSVKANSNARHTHSNTDVLENITSAGSGIIISAAERSKLNSIESGATGDMSASEIIALINGSASLISDARIASTIARDSEVSAAISAAIATHTHDNSSITSVTQTLTNDSLKLPSAAAVYLYLSSFSRAGADTSAIHKNAATEISTITQKSTVAASDVFIIEDSSNAYVKKSVRFDTFMDNSIDGGSPSTIYTQTQSVDGGTI